MQESQKEVSGIKDALKTAWWIFFGLAVLHWLRRLDQPISESYWAIITRPIALTSVFMLGIAYMIDSFAVLKPAKWGGKLSLRNEARTVGLMLIVFHLLIQFSTLTPVYYPKMFLVSGKLNIAGSVSLLFGELAFIIMLYLLMNARKMIGKQADMLGWISFILANIHFFVVKWEGWLKASNWPNYLPPGTFLAFVFFIFVFVLYFIAKLKEKKNEQDRRIRNK
jgi:hypothetical protein